jgi:hypothetical protein
MTSLRRSASTDSHSTATRSFFSVQPKRTSSFFVQTKLTMGAPGDPYEREADEMADQVVQRMPAGGVRGNGPPPIQAKCTSCAEEEKVRRQPDKGKTCEELQKKSDGSAEGPTEISDSVQHTLDTGRGGGQPLDPPLRDDMESAFETDFSDVRIHTGTSAENLNQDLSARAFTYGTDIYFNANEFSPDSQQGRHLLAHELTHVVQQNPGLKRKPSEGPQASTGDKKVQAAAWTFAPSARTGGSRPSGTQIHKDVLPLFAEKNPEIFVEVKIPGANRKDADTGKWGVADFYLARPARGDTMSRTIGLNWSEDGPVSLGKDAKLDGGGARYDHGQHAAPRVAGSTPRVHDAARASPNIKLGDLKPGHSAEAILGASQLMLYQSGIKQTAKDLATWLADPNNSKEQNDKGKWNPTVGPIEKLQIPDELRYPGGKGLYPRPLSVYKDNKNVDEVSGLHGKLYVYKHSKSGIWAYEWLPDKIPDVGASGNVDNVLKRLKAEVIKPVRETRKRKGVGAKKPLPGSAAAVRKREKPRLRRKDDGFPYTSWQRTYGDWKKDAETAMGKPGEKEKANLAEALVDVDHRTGGINLPAQVKERGLGYKQIQHWMKFGGAYGWLRNTFDGVYVKLSNLAEKVKKKVRGFAKRVGGTSFGSWVKAAIKVLFKIFKLVASWVLTQVADKLIASLQEGIANNINKLVEAVTPEGATSKIEEFQEKKAEYEALIAAKEEEIEKRLFGDKLELMEKLETWNKYADQIGTIATVVEWGVRLLACAAPPAIGCLWNLAISALQAAFAMLMQTCWFTKKVYGPVLSSIKEVREFPSTAASYVVKEANDLIPLPAGMEPLFAPIHLDSSDIPIQCGEGDGDGGGSALTAERKAIMDMVEEMGPEKFCALLDVMKKRGAGPWVLLTSQRLTELQGLLRDIPTDKLEAAAKDPKSGAPASLEAFLEDIKKYSKEEKALIKEAADRKQAEAGRKDSGGGEGGGGGTTKAPLYDPPGKVDGRVATVFVVVTNLPQPLKPGGSHAQPLDVYIRIYVKDGNKDVVSTDVYPVRVKLESISATEAFFINQKTFYVFYTKNEFVSMEEGKRIKVESQHLVNHPP